MNEKRRYVKDVNNPRKPWGEFKKEKEKEKEKSMKKDEYYWDKHN